MTTYEWESLVVPRFYLILGLKATIQLKINPQFKNVYTAHYVYNLVNYSIKTEKSMCSNKWCCTKWNLWQAPLNLPPPILHSQWQHEHVQEKMNRASIIKSNCNPRPVKARGEGRLMVLWQRGWPASLRLSISTSDPATEVSHTDVIDRMKCIHTCTPLTNAWLRSSENAPDVVALIQGLLSNQSSLNYKELATVLEKLEDVVNSSVVTPDMGQAVINVISVIMQSNSDLLPFTNMWGRFTNSQL